MRILSCFKGHQAEQIVTPQGRHIITCPYCEIATHQHPRLGDALLEWNNSANRIWKGYEIRWWTWPYRWWRGVSA